MDSTMRTRLRRVHILQRYALVFIAALVWALNAAAQTHCAAAPGNAPQNEGRRGQVTAHAGGDLLRYDQAGRSCEVRLDGRITAWAMSGPGQPTVIAVATVAPLALTFLDTNLQTLQRLRLIDKTARYSSPICHLLVSPQRQSFVALFPNMGELWELSYNPLAAEIGLGMVHDFQYREGHFVPGYLNPQRTALPWNVVAAGLDVDGHLVQLLGPATGAPVQATATLVIHLDVRKPVSETVRTSAPLQACEKTDLLQNK